MYLMIFPESFGVESVFTILGKFICDHRLIIGQGLIPKKWIIFTTSNKVVIQGFFF